MNTNEITTAITTAKNLDALYDALVEFNRLVELGEIEITDMPTDLPSWGDDPGYNDGYYSFDETRLLYPSDALEHDGWILDDRTDVAPTSWNRRNHSDATEYYRVLCADTFPIYLSVISEGCESDSQWEMTVTFTDDDGDVESSGDGFTSAQEAADTAVKLVALWMLEAADPQKMVALVDILGDKKIRQVELGEILGVPQSVISDWQNRTGKGMSAAVRTHVMRICGIVRNACPVDKKWVLG